ncbi:hypothetical protein J3454_15360 [Erythrobacter sp. NFXS35]|uniref:hypothetical protein n=1 Tax=Erythrobacter sp. NFXS35 TaxID=2818436 RepID=UPI0032DFBD9A
MNTTDNANITCEAHDNLAAILEREARAFAARIQDNNAALPASRYLIIADLEFQYDRSRHDGYRVAEGEGAEQSVRWPFHRIAAASWLALRFDPATDVPVIEELKVVAADEADECAIVTQVFGALERFPGATFVSWGAEAKDLAVLRRCAAEFGLMLPHQLRDLSPHARTRLDLCRAVAVQAKPVHLPEYAAATAIPSKPSPAKSIGKLVEAEAWPAVREQVLADVLTAAAIALRHLASHGEIACHPQRTLGVIADAAAAVLPRSKFVSLVFAPWARAQVASSRLRGAVFRAA